MPDYFNKSHKEVGPELQGSVLRGILGSAAGMFVCILALLLCWLCRLEEFSITLLLFVGVVIGWFYRLFRGRRSKTAAYVTVGICTVLTCALWAVALALLLAAVSRAQLTGADWGRMGGIIRDLLLLCVGLGLMGFFFTRRNLLTYADWKKGPWHIAYIGGNGASYNLLPKKLPTKNPPERFAVHSRFAPGTQILVDGNTLQWKKRLRKDLVFSVHDIAGVVLGPSNGCNVLYDKNYQVLAKFAGSMEHADLLLSWLLQQDIPIDKVPDDWRSPIETTPDPEPAAHPVPCQQFTLRLKRSARIAFTGMGGVLLLLGLAFFLAADFPAVTTAGRWATAVVELAAMGISMVCLRIGKVCQVAVDGEQMRVFSRFGRAAEFSVKEIYSVSRSMGWIILYDRDYKTLAKIDSCLENPDKLKEYLAIYGIPM